MRYPQNFLHRDLDVTSPFSTTIPQSNTFVCSNTISKLHPPDKGSTHSTLEGIRTEYHIGISRLNNIADCEIGYSANGHGDSYLLYNTIDNTHPSAPLTHDQFQAVQITAPSSLNILDLSGSHSGGDDYGGYNTVKATYDDWATGLVTIGSSAKLYLGNVFGHSWTNYGKNNLFLSTAGNPTPPCQPTDDNAYILIGEASSSYGLVDLDYNFWGLDGLGNKIDPANETSGNLHWNADLISTQVNSSNVNYTTSPTHTLSTLSTFSGIVCGTTLARSHSKNNQPQSILDTTTQGCTMSYSNARDLMHTAHYQPSYDTLKHFVQRCPTNEYAPGAFGDMSGDVQEGGNGPSPGSWDDFRNWLLSALAWNPGSVQYFCADVETLAGALTGVYGPGPDTTYAQVNRGTNASLAVIQWLIQNPLCNNASDQELYTNGRGSQRETWFNTQDTTKVPLDTTLPSLHDLGLDSVLKYAALLGVHLGHTLPDIITSATASPNPTEAGTVISFQTGREAYMQVAIFDLLGEQVGRNSFEGVLEPGSHKIPISTQALRSGTYYVRITTTYGEVQTVKLVKQE